MVVYHDDGVVHHHAKHHHEPRERDGLQFDSQQIQNAYGNEDADGNGDGSHRGDPKRQKKHGHGDDRDDGDEEVAQEVVDRMGDGLRLVGDAGNLDVLGKMCLDARDGCVHVLAIAGDVVALRHLQGKDHGGLAVVAHPRVVVLIAALDAGHVLEMDDAASRREKHGLSKFALGMEHRRDVNWHLDIVSVQPS